MTETLAELEPNQIVRKCHGHRYFGFKHTQLDKKIADGEIPKPIALTSTGRAKGWLGSQIIEHQRRLIAANTKSND